MPNFEGRSDLGKEFDGEVRGISGDGLGVIESPWKKVYFVAGTWPGDRIRVKVRESKNRYGFGDLLEILSPSVERVVSPCPHQGHDRKSCGGCPWMIGSYPSQIHFKEHRLRHLLERFEVLDPETKFLGVLPSESPFGYRNRAQIKSDGERLGFIAAGTQELVDVKDCAILSPKAREVFQALRSQLPNRDWKPRPAHQWIKLEIDEDTIPSAIKPNQKSIFRQANDGQNQNMKKWVQEKLQSWKVEGRTKGSVLELFCGSGNFTETLLENSPHVFAVEWQGPALERLRARNFQNLSVKDMDLFRSGVWRELRSWIESVGQAAADVDTLFLDPPRDGLKFRQGLDADFPQLQGILYISCDIATLARDLQYFVKKGFWLREVQGLDQFPHTAHLEILCALERR